MKQQSVACVAIIGKPNAGKSTLLNSIVGTKIAGVSRKPQTTRKMLTGIQVIDDCQLVFLDTPGVHRGYRKALMNKVMNQQALDSATDADVILYLVDHKAGWTVEDNSLFKQLSEKHDKPIIVLMTKSDRMKIREAELLRTQLEVRFEKEGFSDYKIILHSSKNPEDVKALCASLVQYSKPSPFLYPDDELSGLSQEEICAEMIQEQLFRQLGRETPYGTITVVRQIFKREETDTVVCKADIVLGNPHHKPIVLGKKGAKIKEIGRMARISMEQYFDCKVFLELHITIEKNWMQRPELVSTLVADMSGYKD